jgi:hypothetical protein
MKIFASAFTDPDQASKAQKTLEQFNIKKYLEGKQ